jgi:hypothetical protein
VVGVLDLLRRRPRTEDAAPEQTTQVPSAPEEANSVQMRGDFMLLPPLRPTFGTPSRIQHTLDDFLVTHRDIAVTSEPLGHEIDPQRLGLVTARARRSTRPQRSHDPLVHRHDAMESDVEEYAQQLPPAAPPRRLPARTPQAPAVETERSARESIVGELPSVAEVHRSVSAPSIRMRVPEIDDGGADLGALRDAARMETATDAPIVRRRGGAALPVADAPEAATDPGDDVSDIDLDSLSAPSAAEMPPLTGSTRVRGAVPPEATAGTRPIIGVDRAGDSPSPIDADTSAPTPATPLEHRSASTTPDDSAIETVSDAPASQSTTGTTPTPETLGAAPMGSATRAETRALLSDRAPLSGARGDASSRTQESKPGNAGRTGVQRKARASASAGANPPARALIPASTGTQPDPSRGESPATTGSSEPSSPALSTSESAPTAAKSTPETASAGTTEAAVEGPRNVEVPPEVRRAVAAATGRAPDSVLVHQGDQVHAEADALNAEAFTRDGEIHLARDADLSTPRGQALLAHELTHVVQQRGGSERMPDEATHAGQQHEELAQKVERAVAQAPEPTPQAPLEHAGGGEAQGSTPANVPQGVQRRGREVGAFGSINRDADDDDNDDNSLIGAPPQPEPAIAHASALQPSVLEQVELVHAGQAPPVREESEAGPGLGARAKSTFERMMLSPAAPKAKSRRQGSSGSALAPITHTDAGSGGSSSGGGEPGTTGEQPRPEPGAKDKALDYFSRMMLAPAAPKPDDEPDERRANLERQADSLYPFLRSRLRAELVRDRERRGRLARDWR